MKTKIFEIIYAQYEDVPTNESLLDLQETEIALEKFKADYFPTMNSDVFFDTVEDKIRTIFLR